jgi:hypothetical protein
MDTKVHLEDLFAQLIDSKYGKVIDAPNLVE